MFCPKCGAQNSDTASFCVSCGAPIKTTAEQRGNAYGSTTPPPPPPPPPTGGNPSSDQGADTILKVVSFCFPIVGLILYFVWKSEKPKSASDVCKFSAIGFGVLVVLYILYFVFMLAMVGTSGGY